MINYVAENGAFSMTPSASLIALAKSNQTIELINTLNGEIDTLDVITGVDTDIHFIDENMLAYVNQNNSLVTYDLNSKEVSVIYNLPAPVTVIKSKGRQLAISVEKKLLLINLDGNLEYELKGCRGKIMDVCYSYDSDRIFATGDKKVHMWDLSIKKPKSTPVATLETSGISLSISKDDRFFSVTETGKYNQERLHVYDLENKQQVLYSPNDIDCYSIQGGFFSSDDFVVKSAGGLLFIDISTWTVKEEIQDIYCCCVIERAGVIALNSHNRVRLVNRGNKTLYQTPVKNLSPVTSLLRNGEALYSVSNADIVKRELEGHPISRNKDFFFRDIQTVVETFVESVIWVVTRRCAILLDLETNEELAKTDQFKNQFGRVCRTSNNRTIFVSSATVGSDGCISEYSDDGESHYHYKKIALLNVLAVWETADGVRLLGSHFRNCFNPKSKKMGGQEGNANIYTFAYIDSESDKLFIAEEVDGSIYLKCIRPDFSNETSPDWRVDIDDYSIIDWAIPEQTLILKKPDGSLYVLDCKDGGISVTNIIEPRATCTLAASDGRVALGLDNGMVSTQQLCGST